MADIKISALPAAGALGGTEAAPVVQGGVTKQAAISQIPTYLNSLASISFGQGFVQITTTGITAANWSILGNGSASFASGGLLTISDTGLLTVNGSVMLKPTGEIEIAVPGVGVKMQSPNGTVFTLTVDNAGQLNIT